MLGSDDVYIDRQWYLSRVLTVSWDTVSTFRELGVSFVVLITGDDSASKRMVDVLRYFLENKTVDRFVLHLPVSSESEEARKASVSVVPQIRLFRRGMEEKRVRGTLGYSSLSKLLL